MSYDYLRDQVAQNTRNMQKQFYRRGTTIARTYGEEHRAVSESGKATFTICTDVDMVYISDYSFKIVVDSATLNIASGSGLVVDIVKGVNTYPTVDSWIAATPVGSILDVDLHYGAQCWDYACALWFANVNRTLLTGPRQAAYEIWTVNRVANAGTEFDLITDKTKLKRGDFIIWGQGFNNYGHVAMAAEDYHGSYLRCYGQNQNGVPYPQGGAAVNILSLSLAHFIGAFRYKNWN